MTTQTFYRWVYILQPKIAASSSTSDTLPIVIISDSTILTFNFEKSRHITNSYYYIFPYINFQS